MSFCAPDRNHEKGFAYICRDGTTRRWICHGFLALKESVSPAVVLMSGCHGDASPHCVRASINANSACLYFLSSTHPISTSAVRFGPIALMAAVNGVDGRRCRRYSRSCSAADGIECSTQTSRCQRRLYYL